MDLLLATLALALLFVAMSIDQVIFIDLTAATVSGEKQALVRWASFAIWIVELVALLLLFHRLMTSPRVLLSAFGHDFSVQDGVSIVGGIILIIESAQQIHQLVEHPRSKQGQGEGSRSVASALASMAGLSIVFSMDIVLTIAALTSNMVAISCSVALGLLVLIGFAKPLGAYLDRHPSFEVLAMAFLVMIGMSLVASGFGHQVDEAYIYFAVIFAAVVLYIVSKIREPSSGVEARP